MWCSALCAATKRETGFMRNEERGTPRTCCGRTCRRGRGKLPYLGRTTLESMYLRFRAGSARSVANKTRGAWDLKLGSRSGQSFTTQTLTASAGFSSDPAGAPLPCVTFSSRHCASSRMALACHCRVLAAAAARTPRVGLMALPRTPRSVGLMALPLPQQQPLHSSSTSRPTPTSRV